MVDAIASRFQADEVNYWRDEKDLLVGDVIEKAISEGIQRSNLFLIVLTPRSVRSKWVERELDEAAFEALKGVEVWIVDALRYKPHPTHAHVDLSLSWIARVKPKRAILTNLHVDLDYRILKGQLPAGVEPAYDGMQISA